MDIRTQRSLLLDPASGPTGGGGSTVPSGGEGGSAGSQASVRPVAGQADSTPSFSPPPGHRLVPDQDWSRMESTTKRWSEFGIGDNEVDGFKALVQAVKNRREDPSLLANLLAGKKEQAKEEGKSFDPEKFKADTLAEWRREAALKEHDSKWSEFKDKGLKAKITEILGGKEDETLSPILYKAALHDIMEARYKAQRDQNDPLHGLRGADYGDEIVNGVLTPYGEAVKKIRAMSIKAVADAANRGRSGSVAGNTGGNAGGPKGEQATRPRSDAVREAVAGKLAKLGVGG